MRCTHCGSEDIYAVDETVDDDGVYTVVYECEDCGETFDEVEGEEDEE